MGDEKTEAGAETEAMETDFGSPFAARPRRGARSSDFSSDLSGDSVTPKRWLFGGALAVLNLEFNDAAGAEGVAALAEALAPAMARRAETEYSARRFSVGGKENLRRSGRAHMRVRLRARRLRERLVEHERHIPAQLQAHLQAHLRAARAGV